MRICSITLLVILAKTSWAQQAPSGEWASILVSVKLNEQWASVTDFGYRTIGSDFRNSVMKLDCGRMFIVFLH